jgi:hypothetical protein
MRRLRISPARWRKRHKTFFPKKSGALRRFFFRLRIAETVVLIKILQLSNKDLLKPKNQNQASISAGRVSCRKLILRHREDAAPFFLNWSNVGFVMR